jgi:hypothetical protein
MKLEFYTRILKKNTQIPNLMKILPVGAELFHADRRTDTHMTKLRVALHNFMNSPENEEQTVS